MASRSPGSLTYLPFKTNSEVIAEVTVNLMMSLTATMNRNGDSVHPCNTPALISEIDQSV